MCDTPARAFRWTLFCPNSRGSLALKWRIFLCFRTEKETAASKWVLMAARRCENASISGAKNKMAKSYLLHLKSSKDLETSYEAVRAGFVALALEKNRRATPFVAQARALKEAASRASTPRDLLG